MRYLLGFLTLFALGLVLLMQCGEADLCEDVDCNDDNECTEDVCNPVDGSCSHTALTDGTACALNGDRGQCVAGECVGLCEGIDCDDGNPCTEDVCSAVDGTCSNPAAADGTACPFGEHPGQCSSGVCVGLCEGVECNDDNQCTEDVCNPADGSCSNINRPDGAQCDFDRLPGVCRSGVCEDAELCRDVNCSDDNDCTEDVCDPMDGSCSNPNKVDGAVCEIDDNPGRCTDGRCVGLCEGVDCSDGNECTIDLCDPSNGSCPNPPVEDGTECDFGGRPGVCATGVCVSVCALGLCDDENECTEDLCDIHDGSCRNDPVPDRTECDFNGQAGVCEAGACVKKRSWGVPVLLEQSDASAGFPKLSIDGSGDAIAIWYQEAGTFEVCPFEEPLPVRCAWANRFVRRTAWGTAALMPRESCDKPGCPGGGSPIGIVGFDVGSDREGNAIAVWAKERPSKNLNGTWTEATRFTPAGGWGAVQTVDESAAGYARPSSDAVDVAVNQDGSAIAVMEHISDGDEKSIWANRYTIGEGWGGPALISALHPPSSPYAAQPKVAVDPSGRAIAVWSQRDGVISSIWANRYTPAGGWGVADVIEKDNAGNASGSQVAIDSSGSAIAVWHQSDGTVSSIWANRYTSAGGWGVAELIEKDNTGDASGPQVAVDPSGNAISVWQQSDGTVTSIWANRFTPGGGWGVAELVEKDNTGNASGPQVAVDPNGNAIAVWQQSDGTVTSIWANRYTPGGGWGVPQLVEKDNAGDAVEPQVAVDPSGNAISVWRQSDGTRDNVWANRFE